MPESNAKAIPLVKSFMTSQVIVLKPNMPIAEAAEILSTKNISGAPVVDDSGKVIGIFTQLDVLRWMLDIAYYQGVHGLVGDHMSVDVKITSPDANIFSVAELLLHTKIRRVPVVDEEGKLVGVVSRSDLIRARFCPGSPSPKTPDSGYLSDEIKARLR